MREGVQMVVRAGSRKEEGDGWAGSQGMALKGASEPIGKIRGGGNERDDYCKVTSRCL